MKKILAVVLALVLCMALCAVGSAAGKYKIGVLAPAVTHGWVAGVAYNAEQECLALADEVDYKLYTSNNAEEMTTQLDDLMTWGAQAIVAFPQWEGMEVPIQNAIDSGITVVNFDIVIDADGVYRVTGDNEGMGVESAKYIVEKIGTTGTVVALPVPTSGSVSELRMKGFNDTIKEIAPEMNVIEYATAFTREDGLKDFTDILAANKQIDAVYSLDDETSIGVLQAIERCRPHRHQGHHRRRRMPGILQDHQGTRRHQHLLRAVQPADGARGRGYGGFRAEGREG